MTDTRPVAVSLAPEHDWAAAAAIVRPLLRPAGTPGLDAATLTPSAVAAMGRGRHVDPLVTPGPAGTTVVYALAAAGFDVVVNGEHLISWNVTGATVAAAALANLAAWAADAEWTVEDAAGRRLVASSTGDGWDAARILLPEARAHLAEALGGRGRVLVGLPERHLLVAGAAAADDPEFAELFGRFVADTSESADEPIATGVFELRGGELVPLD